MDKGLVEELLTSPAGAALLAVLELDERFADAPPPSAGVPEDVREDAVTRAAGRVASMRPVGLLTRAVMVADREVSAWRGDGPLAAALALRDAPRRREIAEAVVSRLGERLDAPLDPEAQLWWWTDYPFDERAREARRPLGVGGRRPCGAWVTATWDGLWTCTHAAEHDGAADEASRWWTLGDALVSAWEHFPGPSSRWHLTVAPDARVFEVRRRADWERLVRLAPLARDRRSVSWEFPGMDINEYDISALKQLPEQRAARPREQFRRFVEPDWDVVARHYDAVHLTWSGFLTTEGVVIDLDDGDVTMLRHWSSERTLWLNPVLSSPRAAPGPRLTGSVNNVHGTDVADDPHRQAQDLAWLEFRLGQAALG